MRHGHLLSIVGIVEMLMLLGSLWANSAHAFYPTGPCGPVMGDCWCHCEVEADNVLRCWYCNGFHRMSYICQNQGGFPPCTPANHQCFADIGETLRMVCWRDEDKTIPDTTCTGDYLGFPCEPDGGLCGLFAPDCR
jgi:hypothetical protein